MLPQMILDDENFWEIAEKAQEQIFGIYPEWTDYNAHDPGITMLELLSWMKELQQFHLDQVGQAHIGKYLKLMGGRPGDLCPAEALIRIDQFEGRLFFPKGSIFYAGDICFETMEERYMDAAEVVRLVCMDADGNPDAPILEERLVSDSGEIGAETVVDGKPLRFAAFGEQPKEGNTLWIGLDSALSVKVEQKLYLHFFLEDSDRRNPIGEENRNHFYPLAEYQLFYQVAKGALRQAAILQDTTCQMLEDGFLAFSIEEEMEPGRDGCYWLCLRLDRNDYDIPPMIEDIGLQCIKVRQIHTLAESYPVILENEKAAEGLQEKESDGSFHIKIPTRLGIEGEYMILVQRENGFCRYTESVQRERQKDGAVFSGPCPKQKEKEISVLFLFFEAEYREKLLLGKGNGMPFQKYQVEIPKLCREGLTVMVETEAGSGCYKIWEEREDFDTSGPLDLHFHLDEESGILSFGDCDHGMAPEGEILLAAAHTSLGAGGNVKAGAICRSQSYLGGASVRNDREAVKGADREDHESCQKRLLLERKEISRAVTYEDFEDLAKRTPGLIIENVRAVPITELARQEQVTEEETVFLVVRSGSKESRPDLNNAYQRNILNMLEPRRMIGTKIIVMAPEYIGITIFVEVVTDSDHVVVRKGIGMVLQNFFHAIRADFGSAIHYSAIYRMIDVLTYITGVRSLGLDARGKNIRRSRSGDIFLPVNGLAYLKEWNCVISGTALHK